MAFSLGGLVAYTEENKADLIMKAILGAKTLGIPGIDIRYGVKSGTKIPVLESTMAYQSGTGCAFASSGTTTLTQITLSTNPIVVQEAICEQDLEAYFTQKYLPDSALAEESDIDKTIIERKIMNVAKQNEQMIWQGNTTYTNSTVLKQINGWLYYVLNNGSPVNAANQGTTISTSNVRTIIEQMWSVMPRAAMWNESTYCFVGMDTFLLLLQKLTNDNLFHYVFDDAFKNNKWEITYPGTNMKITAVPGMNNDNPVDTGSLPSTVSNRILMTYASNLLYGTDLTSDSEELETWYSKDNRALRFHMRFRAGTAIKFPEHCVIY